MKRGARVVEDKQRLQQNQGQLRSTFKHAEGPDAEENSSASGKTAEWLQVAQGGKSLLREGPSSSELRYLGSDMRADGHRVNPSDPSGFIHKSLPLGNKGIMGKKK
ncbi:hypothetical protein EYF80_047435 [Liparis tanakae]|uniref:Uncharacterized protein n=1 Tax=Liparis tanakae TaxID=230148 RepID=A0A4Z2FNC1_9TELE|nr:hypothetical protein EYF80_047435 [Liparis tanakae]